MALAAACGAPAVEVHVVEPPEPRPATTKYTVSRPAGSSSGLEVEVCVAGFSPRRFALLGGDAIVEAHREGREDRPLVVERGAAIAVDSEKPGCVVYRARLPREGHEEARVVNEGLLLARPQGAPAGARVEIELEESVGEVLTPYRSVGGVFFPSASFMERSTTWAFVGAGALHRIESSGVEAKVAILPGRRAARDEELLEHLRKVLSLAVELAPDRYPERLSIVVTPEEVEDPGAPIPFGLARRGGGAAVLFVLSATATADDLAARDWVSMHELSHLAFPPMRRSEAWLTEGWATYFQEVLRARAKMIEPREAWRRLHRGFTEGRALGTGRPLHLESAAMWENYAFRRVYWSGAAHALEVDLALRERGERLETVLARIFSGIAFDHWLSFDSYVELLERHGYADIAERAREARAARALPPLVETYERLGIEPRGAASIAFDPDDERVSVRSAIVGGDR